MEYDNRGRLLRTFKILQKEKIAGMLCMELHELTGRHGVTWMDVIEAKSYISKLVSPHHSVVIWLRENHIKTYGHISAKGMWAEYRQAWVEHIIKELENEAR